VGRGAGWCLGTMTGSPPVHRRCQLALVLVTAPGSGRFGRPRNVHNIVINFRTCRDQRPHAEVRTCGPGRVRIASGEDDNHFAGCASLTDLSKRGGNLIERERAVDVNPDVPGNA
jgi:hypothetical protein